MRRVRGGDPGRPGVRHHHGVVPGTVVPTPAPGTMPAAPAAMPSSTTPTPDKPVPAPDKPVTPAPTGTTPPVTPGSGF